MRSNKRTHLAALTFVLLGVGVAVAVFWDPLWGSLRSGYAFLTDRAKIETFITGFGAWAPLVFVAFQILQVIFAPLPGEASGFLGGYLFGVWHGFVYSSVGLAAGSLINFGIGRFLGEHWVRRMVPAEKWQRIDHLVKRQGVIVIFLMFVFPGFPKDYLCLFLGLTHLPLKIFFLLSAVGRMPGTYMLSLQGASLFERNYWIFGSLLVACLLAALLAWRYRDPLYRWVEKFNRYSSKH